MTTAAFNKDVSDRFNGTAKLYKLSEPQTVQPFFSDEEVEFEYIVASSVNGELASETMVFPADEEGTVVDWGELAVDAPGRWEEAVAQAGFEVVG